MEQKCIALESASETEACIGQVKQSVRESDFPHLKDTFVKYLDF